MLDNFGKMSKICLIHILFIILFNNTVMSEENGLTVETKSGPITGFKESFDEKEVNVFLGIPYAKPPVGEHRFRRPESVQQWAEPLVANQWPNQCYQVKNTYPGDKSDVYSEDCLYLNIWSPNQTLEAMNVLKPVLVFIHGGAFYMGSSSSSLIDGKILSLVGDVVVVTLNYRLDAFGFFYADSDEAPGNVGLWDQVMALQWVNDNIETFGGNGQNITLMGHSAGSWSVSLHLLSPHSRHLFQNAIMMSGAAYNYRMERSSDYIKKNWLNAAISIGCAEDTEYSYVDFNPKIIQCLKTASADKILQLCTELELSIPKYAWDRLVLVDGNFLPVKPVDQMGELHFNETKNILIGTTYDEGSLFLLLYFDQFSCDSSRNFSVQEAFRELSKISSYFPSNLQVIGDEVSDLYFNGMSNDSTDYTDIKQRIGSAVGDFYMQCPTIRFAEMLFTENIDFINVYQYHFTYFFDLFKCPWMNKAAHGTDLYFVFGNLLLSADTPERQKQVSIQMIEMFSHFARFGHPKPQNGLSFKPYYAITDRVVKPYYEISENPKPNNNFGIGLKAIECDYLWNEYLDY